MSIQNLRFQNFRNFQSLDLPLHQGFIVLTGPNGSGKTNFLEGIYFGSSLRRFPESKLGQLFKKGEDFFRLILSTSIDEGEKQEVFFQKKGEKYSSKTQINNQEVARTKYIGTTPVISFLPQDLGLLTRSPGNRRRYLNESLGMVSAEYRSALKNYEKVLKQRNELLQAIRDGKSGGSELEIWDEKLAEHGSVLIRFRKEFVKFLNRDLGKIMKDLSEDLSDSRFVYLPSGEEEKKLFLEFLKMGEKKERESAITAVGPHKDDFEVFLGEDNAVGFLSRGQMRSITLALKVLEREYVRKFMSQSPILLLDDVFSEFDREHQERLVEFLKNFEQGFLTTAHLGQVESFLPQGTQVYRVQSGVVSGYV